MSSASVGELRDNLSDYLSRAQYSGERVTVTRNGKPVAVLVSLHDFELLQALEDRLDNQEADEARHEADESGFIPWDRVRDEAG
ncbi:MAG: type II toxin-antitoxin system Phd/YefM family antitoxin [Thermomicrobiales bacterium]